MDEFENAMKGMYGSVSFGVENGDITLSNWSGSIITNDGNILEFLFVCSEDYPNTPPKIVFDKKFLSNKKLSNICDPNGNILEVITQKLKWSKFTSIGEYLNDLKKIIDK